MPGISEEVGSGDGGRRCLAPTDRDQWVLLAVDHEERHLDPPQPPGPVGGGQHRPHLPGGALGAVAPVVRGRRPLGQDATSMGYFGEPITRLTSMLASIASSRLAAGGLSRAPRASTSGRPPVGPPWST